MSVWKKYRWPILAAACAVGCLLTWLMRQCNLYLHIGPINSSRTGGALVFLCLLFLFAWANSVLLRKNNARGIGFVCLLVVEFAAALFLAGCLLWCDGEPRYYTFREPEGKRVIIAEEEYMLFSGNVSFYRPVFPGLMQKLEGSEFSIDDRFLAYEDCYELTWRPDGMNICRESRWQTYDRQIPLTKDEGGFLMYMYNIGSLVLGLAAWVIPLCALGKRYRFGLCCISSLSCCVLSLLLQILEVQRRVRLSDWAALDDTINAVILAAIVMIGMTVVSNVFALFFPRQPSAKC